MKAEDKSAGRLPGKAADGMTAGLPFGDADTENRIKHMRNACRREMRSGGYSFCRFGAANSGRYKNFQSCQFF